MKEILKELIAIESISGNEKNIADYVEKLLYESYGQTTRSGNCVTWKNNWKEGSKGIALGAHLDTVPFNTENWNISKPIVPLEKNGRIYGRGSCDMKAGAALLIDLILKGDHGDNYNLLFFFYDKEEVGFPNGVTHLLNAGWFEGIELCIIPEPTECKVIYGVLGNAGAKLISTGIAAHSSYPEKGLNAIYSLIPSIENVKNTPTKRIENTREAISVTRIIGGAAQNIIPDKVEAFIDYRFDPQKTKKDIAEHFKSYENKHVKSEMTGFFPGVINFPESNPLIRYLTSRTGDGGVAPFWSDIGQLGAAGIPAINFGPGSITQAHTADEYVVIEDMITVRKILKDFLNENGE